MIIVIVLFSAVTILVFLDFLAIRNQMVYSYRERLLNRIGRKTKQEIDSNYDANWERWYEAWDEVDYDKMVIQFWRPLPSFYQNTILSELASNKKVEVAID